MEIIKTLLQVVIALGIFNVWLVRFNKETPYRGGKAINMRGEFAVYGLPEMMMYFVGALKCMLAVGLLVGIWVPKVVEFSAIGMAALMIVAIIMHSKVGDKPIKSLPAAIMLLMSILVIVL